jgi:hypothetical protein
MAHLSHSIWWSLRPFFLAVFVVLSLAIYWLDYSAGHTPLAQTAVAQSTPTDASPTPLPWPEYGVNHISYPAAQPVSEQRYQNGLATGATWNRWPMYWHNVEQQPGDFHWAYEDTAVIADMAHGLKLNAILLGTPGFYRTEGQTGGTAVAPPPDQPTSPFALDAPQTATPTGLYDPIFSDGSDTPGPGKQINPANVWARFVWTAVNRYKPGGLIAQQQGWPAGLGVTHWEMWNEPDLAHFWDGSVADYARLLKVGYLAAKQADANAQILFGGLAVVYDPYDIPYLSAVLDIFDDDPTAVAHAYFHDILALHNYSYAYRSWRAVYIAERRLLARGQDKAIWLNESGVPVWDDYPGPVCEPTSPYRATMQEQADFIIQSALYGAYAGADNIFFFQLYDDCGNVGGDFEFYPPDLCGGPGPHPGGDAFGLFRNAPDNACYTHHPNPETPRPGLAAFQVLTTYFQGVERLWRLRPDNSQEWLAFYQPATQSRLIGVWALQEVATTAVITPTSSGQTAVLIHPSGITETIVAANGVFTLTLPPATNGNTPTDQPINPIGGRPFLLQERDDLPPSVTARAPALAVGMVTVNWSGVDWGSGLASFDVWVAVDNGPPMVWLAETTAVLGHYPIPMGHTYTFTIFGRDKAGNVSGGTAVDVLAPILDQQLYLPLIQR